jgi:CII-binding regulator of phage lambda lysogenization HflD
MTETFTLDFYQLLKKSGTMAEATLNQWIKNSLSKEEAVAETSKLNSVFTENIKKTRQYSEILSSLLNLPTKNDLANTTHLFIQIEEKIDQLDASVYQLTNSIEEIKKEFSSQQYHDFQQQIEQLHKDLKDLKKSKNRHKENRMAES